MEKKFRSLSKKTRSVTILNGAITSIKPYHNSRMELTYTLSTRLLFWCGFWKLFVDNICCSSFTQKMYKKMKWKGIEGKIPKLEKLKRKRLYAAKRKRMRIERIWYFKRWKRKQLLHNFDINGVYRRHFFRYTQSVWGWMLTSIAHKR